MDESQKAQFDIMCKSVLNIERALLGDNIYHEKGLIKKFHDHEYSDEQKFDELFKFQEKQKLWIGWTGILARTIVAGLAVLGGWLIAIFFG